MGTLVFQATLGGSVNLLGPNIATNINFTLPSADGTNGQALTTNGSGVLAFSTVVSAPAGSNTQVQFNNSGAFGASSSLTWNGSVLTSAGFSGPLNGTVGASTASSGAFTTVTASTAIGTASGGTGLGGATPFTSGGVVYASSSSALATGSALTWDGSLLSTTVADNTVGVKFKAATSNIRFLPQDGGAAKIAALNAAESAFYPLITQGSSLQYVIDTSEIARFTSTGLGIGTSSPKEKLDSRGAAVFSGDNTTGTNAYGTAAGLLLSTSSDNTTARITAVSNGANSVSLVLRSLSSGSAVDAVTINPSGNLGLGVTPSAWNSDYKAFNYGSTGLVYGRVSTQEVAFGTNWYRNSAGSFLYSATGFASYYAQLSSAHIWYTAPSGTAGTAATFTERMRLNADGYWLLGSTNITPYNDSTGTGSTAQYPNRLFVSSDGDCGSFNKIGSDGVNWYYLKNGTQVGNVSVTGSSTAYNTSSDYRLKNNITPMTGALVKVAQLKPVTYKWNADGSDGEGFIAHELAEVCPNAVTGEKDAVDADGKIKPQSIDVSFLVATLTAAIQEQQALITQLQADVATLKGN